MTRSFSDRVSFNGHTLCPECKIRNLELKEVMSKKQGSASSLVVLCECDCGMELFRTLMNMPKNYDKKYPR